jgi:hypothetical protein
MSILDKEKEQHLNIYQQMLLIQQSNLIYRSPCQRWCKGCAYLQAPGKFLETPIRLLL